MVGVSLVVYALAGVPLTTHPYSISVVTRSAPVQADALGEIVETSTVGTQTLAVPDGATLSGSWSQENGTAVAVIVEYGTAEYTNGSAASGSYALSGSTVGVPGATTEVIFEVFAASVVTVTFQGSYTAPLL